MYCWGSRANEQLGNVANGVSGNTLLTVAATELNGSTLMGEQNKPLRVAAGNNHSCAIANAKIFCWGSNTHGQLGTLTASVTQPTMIPGYKRSAIEPVWSSTIFY